jgi:hypothetical protein
MGVYPHVSWKEERHGDQLLLVRTTTEPGLTVTEEFFRSSRVELRTDCYCCSCPEFGGDPYCRDHGFAGERPCAEHEMPGTPDEAGVMPVSVQMERKRRDRRADR